MKKIVFFLFILLCLCTCDKSYAGLYDLRCENKTNPLGIDTDIPRFSWKIRATVNGEKQTSYRILVASNPTLLKEDKADFWDSGRTESQKSVWIPYSGRKLLSGVMAYWKVQVWDNFGNVLAWSDPASFSIGLLKAEDWKGDYIGFPKDAGDPQSPLLRKQIEINDKSGITLIHVNSLGYHEVYINGEKVSDGVLSPAVSQFNKRSLALTYDISKFVKKGWNEVVIWLGRGWYQPGYPGVVYDGPLVRAQVETWNKSVRSSVWVTDSSWRASQSGYSLTTPRWGFNSFGGERIDASTAPADMSSKELDKRQWVPAIKIDVPVHIVSPQSAEKNRIAETYNPKNIKQIAIDTFLIDMGTSLSGWVKIKFPPLSKGQQITLSYSDRLDDNGNYSPQNQLDYYIASGKTNEVFCNKFNHHSFRYMTIGGLNEAPKTESITAMLIRTGYDEEASFVCSDEDMNAIHNLIHHTLQCLSLGGYMVDCNHLERLGYGGDGHASTVTAQTMFNFYSLYSNWLLAWQDCIHEDGGLPNTAPCPYAAGGGPYWCAFIVSAPWNTYLNYGDIKILKTYYPVMKHWLKYVDTYTENGLLKRWPDTDYRGWFLGDWATPGDVDWGNQASVELIANCIISECYSILEKIAYLLDEKTEAKDFADRKLALNAIIHNKFFDVANSNYATGSQIDMAYPMLVDATPENLVENVTKQLFSETGNKYNGHIATGLVGVPILVDWAIKEHQPDFIYSMLKKRDFPGYLYMIDHGATATWEYWNGMRSRIHNCYNGIGSWFYQAIGGIRPDDSGAGYRKVIIDPQIPKGVTWAKVTKETPYGTLVVNWKKQNEKIIFNITVPVGCTANLLLSEGVKTLESGQYEIMTKLNTIFDPQN